MDKPDMEYTISDKLINDKIDERLIEVTRQRDEITQMFWVEMRTGGMPLKRFVELVESIANFTPEVK